MIGERRVPDGYKVTEVGIIPKNWELVPMGDIFKFKNGLNKAKEFFGEGTPIINYMDVYKNRGIWFKDIRGKVTLSSNELANYSVQKGDVFFTRTSETPDEIGITSVLLDKPINTTFSGFILRARPIMDILDIEYKRYCFSVDVVRKEIISKCTYTTRALTNGRVLSKINILVPPLAEQKAIAKALSDTDNLIQSLEKLIDKKKKIKLGLMQQLLTGNKRIPGFSGEWEYQKVERFGDIVTGGTPPTGVKGYWNGNIPWVTPTDISTKKYISLTERMITYQGLNKLRKLPKNSVLITCIASIGKNAIIKNDGACNQQINAIIPNANFDSDFLYYLFEISKTYLLSNAGITATNIISKRDFALLEFLVPDLKEQKAISQVLSDMDAEIEALEEKLGKYKTIKQAMMQVLLTGRIRLI